jgi:dephospho-CoA kinase
MTGGIGSGKTTVANLFADLGVPVIDADELARQVVARGEPGHAEIVEQFGSEVLDAGGELDRRMMREHVFSHPEKRERLEAIVHPRVYALMKKQLADLDSPYAIVVVPLLIETGRREIVDRLLVVDSPEELQIERTLRRDGTTREGVENILAAQVDRPTRLAAADDVIENDGPETSLAHDVASLHRRYLAEAARIASERPGMKE